MGEGTDWGLVKEWWSNVYAPEPGLSDVGCRCPSRDAADAHASAGRYARIHVCLKPEGAPKRYADAVDRWIWENGSPATHGWSPRPPRTPKIEESA